MCSRNSLQFSQQKFTKIQEDSPFQLSVSHQYSGVAAVFAVLPDGQLGEDGGITVLELVEEADVCVRIPSSLQVHQICPT